MQGQDEHLCYVPPFKITGVFTLFTLLFTLCKSSLAGSQSLFSPWTAPGLPGVTSWTAPGLPGTGISSLLLLDFSLMLGMSALRTTCLLKIV